jgi:hypothetical protein
MADQDTETNKNPNFEIASGLSGAANASCD